MKKSKAKDSRDYKKQSLGYVFLIKNLVALATSAAKPS
jgi:hypothetical protein